MEKELYDIAISLMEQASRTLQLAERLDGTGQAFESRIAVDSALETVREDAP